ncbi:Divergent protein kinase domain 2A [Plecturocebus cupreus]
MWRLVPPKLGRLSRSLKLAALGSLLVLMVLHSPSLLASWQRNELADRRFLQLNKCPACFGTSWCRRFLNGQVVFEAWGRLRLLDFLNVKNVYFAQYGEPREGGRRRVVLKRLGSQRELAQLDQSICKRATGRPRCDLLQAMPRTEFARLNGDVRLLTPEAVEGWSDLVHCPSQRLLDRLVRRYAETKDSGSFLLRNLKDSERMQLLLTLAFNPEPLVLQVGAEPGRGASCREGPRVGTGVRRRGPARACCRFRPDPGWARLLRGKGRLAAGEPRGCAGRPSDPADGESAFVT